MLLLLKVLFLSYYLIDVVLLVVGLKEIFIENIGFVLWGEVILLNVIYEIRDGAVSPSWKYLLDIGQGYFVFVLWPIIFNNIIS